jgi:glutamate/tyrosine decarboxylase-like PLP-dependent enzyme
VDRVLPLVTEYLDGNANADETPVVKYIDPPELVRTTDFSLPEDGGGIESAAQSIADAMRLSVRTGHPRFFDKLYAGSDPIGQVAEWITATLNTNVHTFAVAPAFAAMELALIARLGELVGFDPSQCDGIFCPGGSYSNLVAMVLARHRAAPHVRDHGMQPEDPRLICFGSAQAHYSLKRSAMVLGLGTDSAVSVKCDAQGAMDPCALDAAIRAACERGSINTETANNSSRPTLPFFVQATAGTTVMGGFDPFDEIAEVCARHGAWLHIDAAWGGTVALSSVAERRALLMGSSRADSLAFNPHKGLGVPLQCAVLLTKKSGELQRSNASCADYLFHNHMHASWDLGDKTLQCGRRADAFKLWLSWRYHGRRGLGARVDAAFDRASDMVAAVKRRPSSFELVADPMFTNVCFWFVPPTLRDRWAQMLEPDDAQYAGAAGTRPTPLQSLDPELFKALDEATSEIYARMQQRGTMLVNFNPLPDHGLPRFFRIVFNSPRVATTDVEFVLDEIERLGADL